MTETKTDELSLQLNEAFDRLEKSQATEPDGVQIPNPGKALESEHKSAKANKTARSDTINQSAQSGIGNFLAIFLGLIAIGIASYAAFTVYKLKDTQAPVQDVTAELASAMVIYDQNLASMRNDIDALTQVSSEGVNSLKETLDGFAESQQDSIQSFEDKLNVSLAEVKQTMGTSSQDWLLAEVEYLIRLGSQRVIMEGDQQGAIALFVAADDIVRDSEGIVAFELRQSLANDIASLKAVNNLDVDGVFVQIGALIKQVNRLQQKQLAFEAEAVKSPETAPEGTWDKMVLVVSSSFSRLMNLVDYRAQSDVITPILPPKEEYYLRQNIVMKLQLAQLGLLRSNQEIFTSSLNDTEEWIKRHFDATDANTITMLETLLVLREIRVEKQMPDVSGSLRAVRSLLARFHQQAANQGQTGIAP